MKTKLKNCVEILDSKRIPLSSAERKGLSKIYPYYGAQGIVDYVDRYIFDGEYILVAEDGNNLKSCSESIATWATGKFWVNNHAHILGTKTGYCLKYIYYLLTSLDLRGYITGSAQPKLNQENLANIELELPDYAIQCQVAEVLSSIDKKKENNSAICSKLESMAKLLYDYWFVQFDFPDENGKPYKSSGGKMVWNEELKREIPEGWEAVSFGECIESINTGLNPRDNFTLNTGGSIKYLTVKNLTKDGTIDFTSCDYIDEEARTIVHRRSDIKIGDILFASISPLGRCYIIMDEPEDWDINESVFSIRPKSDKMTSSFLYMCFTSERFIKQAEGSSTGSVFKGIRIAVLQELKTILPPKGILDRFDEQSHKMFAMKQNALEENKQLASLRDFLLPMLMNGQVKVEDNLQQNEVVIPFKDNYERKFELWLENQGLAARGTVSRKTLRAVFDAMDDDDK